MKRTARTLGIATVAACLLSIAAAPFATGSTAHDAATDAARSDYASAIAGCIRLTDGARRDCLRDADAAHQARMNGARDLDLLSPADGAAPRMPPVNWILPDPERVPDNLARNAATR